MRIISMHVLKWQQDNSFFITSAYQLSFMNFLKRSFLKQTLNFGARTSVNRSKIGQRVAIHIPDAQALCYVYISNSKIAYAVIADDKYPQKIIYLILRKMNIQFPRQFDIKKYLQLTKDGNIKWQQLQTWIKQFQDPKQVDKLQKLKSQLQQVQKIVHKNMDDLLKRDQDLNKLMERSQDINKMSLDFYKTAKKTNKKCCSLY